MNSELYPSLSAALRPATPKAATFSTPPPNYALSPEGVKSAYKEYGFDPHGNNEAWGSISRFLPGIFGQASSQLGFGQGLEGQRQKAIQALINHLSQGSQNAQMQGLQRQTTEQAAGAARNASLINRSNGLGDGFDAGTTAGILGRGAIQNSNIAREYGSPEHQMQVLQAALQAIASGQHSDALDLLKDIGSIQEQRHQANQQEVGSGSFLRQIAPYVGMFAGGLGGGAAGAASGGYHPQVHGSGGNYDPSNPFNF